jgi:hypothetical protein
VVEVRGREREEEGETLSEKYLKQKRRLEAWLK